jgi:hypothetical protein
MQYGKNVEIYIIDSLFILVDYSLSKIFAWRPLLLVK